MLSLCIIQMKNGFVGDGDEIPDGLLSDELWQYFDPLNELDAVSIVDTNSGAIERGVCALPFERQSDKKDIYFSSKYNWKYFC